MATAPKPQQQKSAEEKKLDHSFFDYGGVNTQADRKSIKDNEFAWLENVMPIGHGNLRSIPFQSVGLLASTLPNCYYMAEGNISNVDYMMMFCADGSAYQVNLTSYAVTTIGAAGTFSASGAAMSQWKNERIVIADPTKGFFDWDGVTLTTYKGTVASAVVNTQGMNYTASPTITQTGGSPTTPATFTATLLANLLTQVAAGTGYAVGDLLTLAGGTFTAAATLSVSAITAGGVISGLNLISGGVYTVAPANPVSVTGGHGTGATFTINFGIGAVKVATPGVGYNSTGPTLSVTNGGAAFTGTITGTNSLAVTSVTGGQIIVGQNVYNGAGTLLCTITAGTASPYTVSTATNVGPIAMTTGGVSAALSAVMAINTGGTTIEVYAGRVWMGNNRTVVFTAPNTYNDFNPVNLGGSFIMTDSTLRSVIESLYSANNYLYVIGGESINIISNVTVTSPTYNTTTGAITAPGTTIFSNTNLTSSVGTKMGNSVVSFFRTLSFVNDYGVQGITGSTPQKISDELDGIFPNIDFTTSPSGGTCVIHNIICLCFLVQYVDPVTGLRPLLLVFFGGKWFFASQGAGLKFIATASPNPDSPSMYGTDGFQLYKLYSDSINSITQTIKSKLWNMGTSLTVKQVYKIGIETLTVPTISSLAQGTIDVSVDTEITNQAYSFSNSSVLQFSNNQQGNINFINNSGGGLNFIVYGYKFIRSDATGFGNYLGLTITSSSPGIIYNSMHLQYELRTPWAGTPW
jgi:hypothetical protein